MRQVAQQAVAHIQGAAGNAVQLLAQGHARGGALQALSGACQHLLGQCELTLQHLQRQPGIAQGATHVDVVTGPCAAAQQGLTGRHFAKNGDADVERPARGVAAHQFATVRVCQRKQPARKGGQPGIVRPGQRQCQSEGQRPCAAGRQVGQVHGQGLVAQGLGVHIGKKMAALDQHVAGDGQLHARPGRE